MTLALRRHLRAAAWLVAAVVGLAVGLVLYALVVEPRWVAERRLSVGSGGNLRLVHLTDIHYRGDRSYLERIVRLLNATDADLVCFTGDLLEDLAYLDEALEILTKVEKPMYGVPGNHDCWDRQADRKVSDVFLTTGGRWLRDERVLALSGRLEIVGSTSRVPTFPRPLEDTHRARVLLVHAPSIISELTGRRFDLILAGHTHGGQIRLPFHGPLVEFLFVGEYDRGLFDTDVGPLYVNPGIGTYHWHVRFCCRPELAILDL